MPRTSPQGAEDRPPVHRSTIPPSFRTLRRPLGIGLTLACLALPARGQTPPAPDPSGEITRGLTTAISRNIEAAVVKPRLVVRNPAGPVTRIALAPDERTVALVMSSGDVRVWDLETGAQLPTLRTKTGAARVAVPLAASRGVLVGFDDGSLRVLDLAGGVETALPGRHGKAVSALVLSADGARAASAAADGSVRVLDLESRTELASARAGGAVNALAIRADGARVAAASGGTVQLFDASGAVLRSIDAGDDVLALAFVRDGGAVALATRDGGLALHDAETGARLAGSDSGIEPSAVAFDADGVRATLGDEDGGVHRAVIAGGEKPVALRGHEAAVRDVTAASRSARLFSADARGVLKVFDAESGENLLQALSTETGWAVIDRQGRFDGSDQGMRDVGWSAGDRELDLERFAQRFFEPGLLATFVQKGRQPVTEAPGSVEAGIALPPKVSIDLPDESRVAGQPFQLVVVAEDQGGGIDEVRLYHNGKLVVPGALVQQQDADTGKQRLRAAAFRVKPVAGVNTLRGVASGRWGIEGESERVTLEFKGEATPPVLRVLSVGIDHYADSQLDLDYAVRDADEFVKELRTSAGGSYSEVQVTALRDAAATREGILGGLRALAEAAPEDVLVIYLAGHGIVAGDDWSFLPHETRRSDDPDRMAAGGLRAGEIRDALVNARSQRVLVLIDSCESGAGVESFERMGRFQRRYIRQVSRLAGVSVVAAARQDQRAAEIQQLGHGLFTYVLLKGLEGDADRRPTDRMVTAHELVAYSADVTPGVSREYLRYPQEPLAFALGADFSLGRLGN